MSEEEKRKRGGQPGNKNALKYGYYSHGFTRAEKTRLETDITGELNDEEALLNVLIDRTFQTMREEEMTHREYVAALRAISMAMGRKESIHRSRKAVYERLTSMEQAMKELGSMGVEED